MRIVYKMWRTLGAYAIMAQNFLTESRAFHFFIPKQTQNTQIPFLLPRVHTNILNFSSSEMLIRCFILPFVFVYLKAMVFMTN